MPKQNKPMTASEMGKRSHKLRKKRMTKEEYSEHMKWVVSKRKKNPVKNKE